RGPLAHLLGDEGGQVGGPLSEQLGDPLHDRDPVLDRPLAPFIERAGGGGEGLLDFGVGREGELFGYLAGRGVCHLVRRRVRHACSRFPAVKVSVRQRYGRGSTQPKADCPTVQRQSGTRAQSAAAQPLSSHFALSMLAAAAVLTRPKAVLMLL